MVTARPVNRLTHRFVTTVKEPGFYADGGGLYLRVDASGARRWVYVFQYRKRRKEMGLGAVRDVGVGDARKARDEARKILVAGRNPIDERDAAGEAPLFGDFADTLLDDVQGGFSSLKHIGQWKRSLTVHAAPIRDKAVDQITTDDILEMLKPIWSTIPETASRARGRVERVLDAAKAKGHIKPPWENPARWVGHLDKLLTKRSSRDEVHHSAMPFSEAPAFVVDLRARQGVAALALEFTILTALRTSEVIGAHKDEFDLEAAIWTVPADRMKGKKEHRVPLSPRAVEIVLELAPLRRADGYVFPGPTAGKFLSTGGMERVLDRMGLDRYTVHGFRSTFRDWAYETTNFQNEIVEQALAHAIKSKVEAAYRRGDALLKRRKLMEAWAGYLARPAAAGSNVRAIGG